MSQQQVARVKSPECPPWKLAEYSLQRHEGVRAATVQLPFLSLRSVESIWVECVVREGQRWLVLLLYNGKYQLQGTVQFAPFQQAFFRLIDRLYLRDQDGTVLALDEQIFPTWLQVLGDYAAEYVKEIP